MSSQNNFSTHLMSSIALEKKKKRNNGGYRNVIIKHVTSQIIKH